MTPTETASAPAGVRGDVTADVDVAVIGAGIVGSAVARELSGYQLAVALIESRSDVGDGTSKANTAILHTGFDAKPGTLEARLVRRGYTLLSDYARRAAIPVERTGALLVAWSEEEVQALPGLRDRAISNGYDRCQIVDSEDVYWRVSALGPGALAGLTVPDESIICTWTTNLALATDARLRGVRLLLGHHVTGVIPRNGGSADRSDGPASSAGSATVLQTSAGNVRARWVINAAGLGSDHIDRLFGYDRFTITPRRGELIVFDKLARHLVDTIVLPVPTSRGKGVLISPTIYGNVMLGPTSEDLTDRGATGTSEAGLTFLVAKGEALMPRLLAEEVTASYAGLRAASEHGDYVVEVDPNKRYVVAGGIRSTGLTSGMALAEYIRDLLRHAGLHFVGRTDLPITPTMPNLGEATMRPYQDAPRIAADPAYGHVVCFCERVTDGEIRDTFASPVPPTTLEGLRRRTRAMNGRCQGFYCGARIADLLAAGVDHDRAEPSALPPRARSTNQAQVHG